VWPGGSMCIIAPKIEMQRFEGANAF
jgi:hypothetical protein